jgi:hypothetical protein
MGDEVLMAMARERFEKNTGQPQHRLAIKGQFPGPAAHDDRGLAEALQKPSRQGTSGSGAGA